MFLTDSQVFLLNQIIRDGVTQANGSLKEMLGSRLLRVDVIDPQLLPLEEVARRQEEMMGQPDVDGACMDFSGPFCGKAMLVCPECEKADLVSVFFEPLMHEDMSIEDREEIEKEAICELGNILLSACIASFSRIFDGEIRIRVPKPVMGRFSDLIRPLTRNNSKKVLFMPTTLYLGRSDRHLGFGFVFDMISVHALAICLQSYLEKQPNSANSDD